MVKARGPSKGADWIARERGMTGRVHSSSSLFNQKGNPWLTRDEQNRDFPLNRSTIGDNPETEYERQGRARMRRLKEAMGIAPEEIKDFQGPKPRVTVDPDLDRYVKAELAKPKEKYIDPKGKAIVSDYARQGAQRMMRLHKAMRGNVIDIPEDIEKPKRIKGNFYDFSSPPMTDEKRRRLRVKKGRKR